MRTGVEVDRYELYREWNTELKHVLCASQRQTQGREREISFMRQKRNQAASLGMQGSKTVPPSCLS